MSKLIIIQVANLFNIKAIAPFGKDFNVLIYRPCQDFVLDGPPCMKAGICEKHYPKPFQKYSTYQDGFIPLYKRSKPGEGGFTTQTWCRYKNEMVEIDNRNIVPYNRYLLAKYQIT